MNYLEKWSLTNPAEIATTKTAKVYTVDRGDKTLVLKVLTELGKVTEGKSASALKYFAGKGSVKVFEYDEGALLMEYLEGKKLKDIDEGAANTHFLNILKKLHQIHPPKGFEFDSMERRYRSLLERGEKESFFKKGAQLAEKLVMKQSVKVLLHGDLHHTNIINSKKRGWLAIDPQPLIGDPLFDLGNFFYNPDDKQHVTEDTNSIRKRLKVFSKGLEVDEEIILHFAIAHGYLSSSWQLDIKENPKRRLKILEKLERLA